MTLRTVLKSIATKSTHKNLILIAIISCAIIPSTQALASSGFFDPGARAAAGSAAASGGLIPTEEEFDAGELSLGATSQVVTLFRNEGGRAVKIKGVKLYASSTISAEISQDNCSIGPLPSGAECPIIISVKGLKTGSWNIQMLLGHDGRSQLTKTSVTGTVAAGSATDDQNVLSDIESIPNEIDFGSLSSSQPLIKSVVFRNISSKTLTVEKTTIAASDQSGYRLDHDCGVLNPSQACLATVTWAPQQAGQSDGVIIIEHSGSSRVASIPLLGEFTPDDTEVATIFPNAVPGRGLLVTSQEEIDFEGGIENEASISLSLVNVGDADLELSNLSLSGTDNGLSVLGRGCQKGTILRPIEACPLTLSWSPVREGSILDDLQIEHTGARGILVVPIRGEATAAVSKDSQAIIERDGVVQNTHSKSDALAGFSITSHSLSTAIVVGPGGSRIVKNDQPIVIGGVEWDVNIRRTGIQFHNGSDKINLLFDRSLSSNSSGSATTSGTAQ